MIDFELTEEQKSLKNLSHKFAVEKIRPVAEYYDNTEQMPWPVMEEAHKLGLTNFYFPEKYGGRGLEDFIAHYIVAEELAWGCAGIQTCIMSTGLAATAIMGMGTEAQKKKYIPLFCDPDNLRIGAMGLTEPAAGTDIKMISTTAKKDGSVYILNGTKCFITNGGIADVHVIFATTDKSRGLFGLAGFIIEKGTPGLSMGKKEKKLGVRASHTAEVILEDCKVPEENRLGGGGGESGSATGVFGVLNMLEVTRPGVASAAVGIARAAFEYALEYSKQRVQFEKQIIKHQAIGFRLADMAVKIDAARLLVWRAGWMVNKKISFRRGEASMAKLFAGDICVEVATDAIQILGGYGYMKDHPVEKWYRDAKIYQIWEGTAEAQRMLISSMLRGQKG